MSRHTRRRIVPHVLPGLLGLLGLAAATTEDTRASRALPEYRYFRALSIDLRGRPPTRQEISAFEQPDFDLDRWLDAHLQGPDYAARLRRIYMDLLRLELPETAVVFKPSTILLHRATILDPAGRPLTVYFREAQRRARPEIDGQACFTEAETGLVIRTNGATTGTARPVAQALIDARTVVVKPWWLYADYRDASPRDRLAADWAQRFPGFELVGKLFLEPDGTPTTSIRVCREEAQTAEHGRVYASGRKLDKTQPIPPGRTTRLPADSAFATANAGALIGCASHVAYQSSHECGCGVGLERCLPSGPAGFVVATDAPLGSALPFTKTPRSAVLWLRTWWTEEVVQFFDRVFGDDRDVRELLTSRGTVINGPLAQFYRFFVGATCCGPATELGYTTPVPLFDPAAVPRALRPHDAATWVDVADRGPNAAGLMTMPAFLLKYGSRRQRANAIMTAFTCKELVADATARLPPSDEPDLTKRPGCATCHRKLEPMAAYFARIEESDWTYLPPATFPLSHPACAKDPARMSYACKLYYDPAFTDARRATLRGTHVTPEHAAAGPPGFARAITSSPEFAPCVVRNVAQSFLGRAPSPADQAALTKVFVDGGYRMRALVRAIVTSPAYRDLDDRRAP